MKTKITAVSTIILCILLFSHAQAEGPKWNDHQAPFSFIFNNHIDTHQQTTVLPGGELFGYLYVEFTGDLTAEGIPIARHSDCSAAASPCSVGWQWRGIPGKAEFVYQEPGDHPLWLVNRDKIVQPGAYGHFHWLGLPMEASELVTGTTYDGYFLELTAKDTFAFEHGDDLVVVRPGIDLATHLNIVTVFP